MLLALLAVAPHAQLLLSSPTRSITFGSSASVRASCAGDHEPTVKFLSPTELKFGGTVDSIKVYARNVPACAEVAQWVPCASWGAFPPYFYCEWVAPSTSSAPSVLLGPYAMEVEERPFKLDQTRAAEVLTFVSCPVLRLEQLTEITGAASPRTDAVRLVLKHFVPRLASDTFDSAARQLAFEGAFGQDQVRYTISGPPSPPSMPPPIPPTSPPTLVGTTVALLPSGVTVNRESPIGSGNRMLQGSGNDKMVLQVPLFAESMLATAAAFTMTFEITWSRGSLASDNDVLFLLSDGSKAVGLGLSDENNDGGNFQRIEGTLSSTGMLTRTTNAMTYNNVGGANPQSITLKFDFASGATSAGSVTASILSASDKALAPLSRPAFDQGVSLFCGIGDPGEAMVLEAFSVNGGDVPLNSLLATSVYPNDQNSVSSAGYRTLSAISTYDVLFGIMAQPAGRYASTDSFEIESFVTWRRLTGDNDPYLILTDGTTAVGVEWGDNNGGQLHYISFTWTSPNGPSSYNIAAPSASTMGAASSSTTDTLRMRVVYDSGSSSGTITASMDSCSPSCRFTKSGVPRVAIDGALSVVFVANDHTESYEIQAVGVSGRGLDKSWTGAELGVE